MPHKSRVLKGKHIAAKEDCKSLMRGSFSIRNSSPFSPRSSQHDRSLKSASEKISSIDLSGGNIETPNTDHFSWANDIVCDEIEDPSLFSSSMKNWNNTIASQKGHGLKFPFPRTPPRSNNKFEWMMRRYNMISPLDPNLSYQKILCRNWIHRHEVLLRRIYFPHVPKDSNISIHQAVDLYVRYQGADSTIMSQTLLSWPFQEEDPRGTKTFDGCPRPPWLLDYLYSWLSNNFISINSPETWSYEFKNMLISTNLPMSLLHPVELESELGRNYFPVTSKDFSEWINPL